MFFRSFPHKACIVVTKYRRLFFIRWRRPL